MILYDKKQMTDVSVVGGKGVGLAKLVNYGCAVPDFFIVTAGTVFDDGFAAELERFAAMLHCDAFSVRSSNVNEDTEENSFAGQYLTLLNVSAKDLPQAVKDVSGSAFSKRAGIYSNHFKTSPSTMAVIVQKQITGKYSGVIFTRSLTSSKELLVESVEGAGEQLVSGTVTPRKKVLLKDDPRTEGPYEASLVQTAMRLESSEGCPLDIEWTFSDRLWFLQMRPMTVLGDDLPQIPKHNWNFYVYRDFCILVHSVQRRASERDAQEKRFGFSVPIEEGLLVNGREFYSDENDAVVNAVWAHLDNGDFFERYIDEIKALVRRTKRYVCAIKKRNYASFDTRRLFTAFKNGIGVYIDSYLPLMMRPDDHLVSVLRSMLGDVSSEMLSILTPVWRKTFFIEEKKDFLAAKICGDVKTYFEKYEWTQSPLGKKVSRLKMTDVEKRLERLTVEQAASKYKQMQTDARNKKAQFDSLLDSQKDPAIRRALRLVSEFIFLRTYTAENSDRLFFYIRENILTEIAARSSISIEDILCMTFDEIAALENGQKISRKDMAKRKSGELITFFHGENRSYYSAGAGHLLSELTQEESSSPADLSGEVACPGEVEGCVKIIRNFEEADKVEEGDIVVTSMTLPEIVAALEKAGGIITDEGGVTCHAAILSREYGVPCLVGTQCATRVLRDDMRVRLDCVRGKVVICNGENV